MGGVVMLVSIVLTCVALAPVEHRPHSCYGSYAALGSLD